MTNSSQSDRAPVRMGDLVFLELNHHTNRWRPIQYGDLPQALTDPDTVGNLVETPMTAAMTLDGREFRVLEVQRVLSGDYDQAILNSIDWSGSVYGH